MYTHQLTFDLVLVNERSVSKGGLSDECHSFHLTRADDRGRGKVTLAAHRWGDGEISEILYRVLRSVQGTRWVGLTDSVDVSHGGPTPDVARHLAVVGGQKCLLPDQLQCCQNIGYVIETPHFS